ncbi:hypothetical protein [Paraliobacillus ryukyuensis]|uniref:hypothetical protein n=1 Tax=Paraliobacillus ryukyuensis TaxID=200904 RepID=UPI0009A6123F|nr:hypothetical protein [Paraliobacillus ryukyuensis]
MTLGTLKTDNAINSFTAFQNRLRKVMCDSSKRDIQLELNDEQLETLYNAFTPVIETSIYAEMEHVMTAIRTSFDAVTDGKGENIKPDAYMSNDKHFKRFITHAVTNYQSLQAQRINIIIVHNKVYQRLEDSLFGETFVSENGFQTAYELHNQLIQAFHDGYHDLLSEGTILDTGKKIEDKVIEPVVQRYDMKMQELLEDGEDG